MTDHQQAIRDITASNRWLQPNNNSIHWAGYKYIEFWYDLSLCAYFATMPQASEADFLLQNYS